MAISITKKYLQEPALRVIGVCVVLFLVTAGLYGQIIDHGFVNYDDNIYLIENLQVQQGITAENVQWAFRSTLLAHWHPLTWLSHMLDVELFGMDAGGHHFTNLIFHSTNSVLLFLVLHSMTGHIWRSAFVAALFALHPLHVESVAWASERKDVLSTFFWLLTMCSYVWYVRRSGIQRYLTVVALFACSLMSKSMPVTLPFVLLLLDVWPLRRIRFGQVSLCKVSFHGASGSRIFYEKLPLLLVTFIACILILFASREHGALSALDSLSVAQRCINALVAYTAYVARILWPEDMSVLYLLKDNIPLWQGVASALFLIIVSAWSVKLIKNQPFVFVGWFWFLGTLVPVIGIVQVGVQFIADRYTYIPSIGFFIIFAWGPPLIADRMKLKRSLLAVPAVLILVINFSLTWMQLPYWKNSARLFQHALNIDENNYVAHNNLGQALVEQGKLEGAISHYNSAIEIKPDFSDAYYNLGLARISQDRPELAVMPFMDAIRIDPNYVNAWNNLGNTYLVMGQLDQAILHYRRTLQLDPDHEYARSNLTMVLSKRGAAADEY